MGQLPVNPFCCLQFSVYTRSRKYHTDTHQPKVNTPSVTEATGQKLSVIRLGETGNSLGRVRLHQNSNQSPNTRFRIRKKIKAASSARKNSSMNIIRPLNLREQLYVSRLQPVNRYVPDHCLIVTIRLYRERVQPRPSWRGFLYPLVPKDNILDCGIILVC
jgi:hypothetical protein